MQKKQTLLTILYNPLEKYLPDCIFGYPILYLSTVFVVVAKPASDSIALLEKLKFMRIKTGGNHEILSIM